MNTFIWLQHSTKLTFKLTTGKQNSSFFFLSRWQLQNLMWKSYYTITYVGASNFIRIGNIVLRTSCQNIYNYCCLKLINKKRLFMERGIFFMKQGRINSSNLPFYFRIGNNYVKSKKVKRLNTIARQLWYTIM